MRLNQRNFDTFEQKLADQKINFECRVSKTDEIAGMTFEHKSITIKSRREGLGASALILTLTRIHTVKPWMRGQRVFRFNWNAVKCYGHGTNVQIKNWPSFWCYARMTGRD